MAVTLELGSDLEAKLRGRADELGMTPEGVAKTLLWRGLSKAPPFSISALEEISGDVYRRFLASGQTEEELGEELERIKHQGRTLTE